MLLLDRIDHLVQLGPVVPAIQLILWDLEDLWVPAVQRVLHHQCFQVLQQILVDLGNPAALLVPGVQWVLVDQCHLEVLAVRSVQLVLSVL